MLRVSYLVFFLSFSVSGIGAFNTIVYTDDVLPLLQLICHGIALVASYVGAEVTYKIERFILHEAEARRLAYTMLGPLVCVVSFVGAFCSYMLVFLGAHLYGADLFVSALFFYFGGVLTIVAVFICSGVVVSAFSQSD